MIKRRRFVHNSGLAIISCLILYIFFYFTKSVQYKRKPSDDPETISLRLCSLWRSLFKSSPDNADKFDVVETQIIENSTSSSVSFPCPTVHIKQLSFPLCTYESHEDIYVSQTFLLGSYWERGSVAYLMDYLRSDDRLEFIDIGANVGGYTLAVAHSKRRVVALEPNKETLKRLIRSIHLGNVSSYITLLSSAVSDGHRTIMMRQNHRNRGDSSLLNQNNCSKSNGDDCLPTPVRTIILDDLLPLMTSDRAIIKMDIQGHETKAINAKGANKFLNRIRVPIIYTEFQEYIPAFDDVKKRREVDEWLTFLRGRNYTAHHYQTRALLGADWRLWPGDVVFMRKY